MTPHGRLALLASLLALAACAPAQVASQPASAPAAASQPAEPAGPKSLWDRETLTDGWFGTAPALAEKGLSFALNFTQIYQANTRGGLSTNSESDRYAGRYDLEFNADMDKLAGLKGGRVYAIARGSWNGGLNPAEVGGITNPNAVPIGDEPVVLWQFYYEQVIARANTIVRVGRLDLTGGLECRGCKVSFDGNRAANDEIGQFLNGCLVNNPTIPFPAPGMGVLIHTEPIAGWYVSAAAADADAKATRSGFDTTFDSPCRFFTIYETGLLPQLPSRIGPLQGAYRVGFWVDPRPLDRFGGGHERDTVGFYTSCDQMVWRPSDKVDDTRGLTLFARYGLADADVSTFKNFWSTGLQYQGLLPGRDNDVAAVAVGSGAISRQAGLPASSEAIIETYYNIAVTPWLHVTPDFQYVFHPGGESVGDAVIVGVRVQLTF